MSKQASFPQLFWLSIFYSEWIVQNEKNITLGTLQTHLAAFTKRHINQIPMRLFHGLEIRPTLT